MTLIISEVARGVEVIKECERILEWLLKKIKELDVKEVDNFTKEIFEAGKTNTIFLAGLGRSGLVAEAFAMRLAHLADKVRVLKETTCPPVKKDDLVIIFSGSGTNLDDAARIAKDIGARIIVITSDKESKLAKLADLILTIPGREKEDADLSYPERIMRGRPVLPLGSAFELLAWIVTAEGVIGEKAAEEGKGEKDLKKEHVKPQI